MRLDESGFEVMDGGCMYSVLLLDENGYVIAGGCTLSVMKLDESGSEVVAGGCIVLWDLFTKG